MFVAHSADISCSICLPLFKEYVLQITVVKIPVDCLNGSEPFYYCCFCGLSKMNFNLILTATNTL